jgi:hypothetical protein
VSTRRVCAWCGRFESEMTGAQSEITHGMCATCVRERKCWDLPAPEMRRQCAAQAVRRDGVPELSEPEIDTARPTNGRASKITTVPTVRLPVRLLTKP